MYGSLLPINVRRKQMKVSNRPLRPLMFVGTGSDVGKSIIATGLCRILLQDGYQPAPFKAQNMALNSFATPEGLELGRAQAVQAEAAGISPHTDMNPVLLKPSSDRRSQIVLNGRAIGDQDAYEYFRTVGRGELRGEVHAAFDRLSARYNPIVMEGAGSISELNLQKSDLVNMSMAEYADATVILVADIDRGGVFASVYGSIMLQKPDHRKLIKGILINKFRGDIRLFDEGKRMLEELCGVPVVGIVPYYTDIHIEEEDSVALGKRHRQSLQGKVNIAVVLLRYISNYTDFARLEQDPRVHLFYTNNVDELAEADIIILPGSKSTLADLYELRRNGVAQAVISAQRAGKTVLGICGGYQMMGMEVLDPEGVEGELPRLPGLGLLPTSTTMAGNKITKQVGFRFVGGEGDCIGYEIHMGRTVPVDGAVASPLARLHDGRTDGYRRDDRCMGTYLHGILDNPPFVDYLLAPFADRLSGKTEAVDYDTYKNEQYDRLADHLRKHLNIDLIYQMMQTNG